MNPALLGRFAVRASLVIGAFALAGFQSLAFGVVLVIAVVITLIIVRVKR